MNYDGSKRIMLTVNAYEACRSGTQVHVLSVQNVALHIVVLVVFTQHDSQKIRRVMESCASHVV